MNYRCFYCVFFVILGFVLFAAGCQNGSEETPSDNGQSGSKKSTGDDSSQVSRNGQDAPSANSTDPIPYEKKEERRATEIPTVKMTAQGRKTCLVFQEDLFPSGTLTNLEGGNVELESLMGDQLTIVAFWTRGQNPFAEMGAVSLLEDLQKQVFAATQQPAVQVVAVNEGDSAEEIQEIVKKANAEYPVLQDPEGKFFEKIATSFLPRIYAIGPKQKILWMDIEYSEATRDELQTVLEATTGESFSQ